jgi:hypothetical protein
MNGEPLAVRKRLNIVWGTHCRMLLDAKFHRGFYSVQKCSAHTPTLGSPNDRF